MKYERLTKKGSYYDKDDYELNLVIELDERHYEKAQDIDTICEKLNRLCELEDKIERGELVENTVVTYVNMGRSNSKTLIDKALKYDELKAKIENGTLIDMPRIIHPNKAEWYVQYQYPSGVIQYYICFSEAEAEKKLKESIGKDETNE